MNLTSLAAPASLQTDTFNVTSLTGAVVGGFCKIDEEYSIITEIPPASTTVVVRSRGSFGGVSAAHAAGAPVVFGTISELPANGSGRDGFETVTPNRAGGYRLRTISADGAVDVASLRDHTEFLITKGSLCAITLNQNPSLAQDGLRVRFVARTNFAHTITRTAGFLGGTATASDVLTLAASGATAEFEAQGGLWALVSGTAA